MLLRLNHAQIDVLLVCSRDLLLLLLQELDLLLYSKLFHYTFYNYQYRDINNSENKAYLR